MEIYFTGQGLVASALCSPALTTHLHKNILLRCGRLAKKLLLVRKHQLWGGGTGRGVGYLLSLPTLVAEGIHYGQSGFKKINFQEQNFHFGTDWYFASVLTDTGKIGESTYTVILERTTLHVYSTVKTV
jgi:hypothetical protein